MSRPIVPAIESPCPKEWNQMQGDGKCRYCEHCQLHVHNLSAMTAQEQRSLFAKAQGRVCVAYDESESRPVQLGLWRWWQRLTLPMRAGLALVTAFIPMLSSCRSVPTPPAGGDPIVRNLHQSADGSVRLGKVKVEPESSSEAATEWNKDGKMIAGGIMPGPLPWWKRLLHLN